ADGRSDPRWERTTAGSDVLTVRLYSQAYDRPGSPAPAGPVTRRQAGADRRSAARSLHRIGLVRTPPRGDGREQPVPPPGTRRAAARRAPTQAGGGSRAT